MPLEFDDPDGDGVLRPTADRLVRPSAMVAAGQHSGRVFLTATALVVLSASRQPASCLRIISNATRVSASPAPATSRLPALPS